MLIAQILLSVVFMFLMFVEVNNFFLDTYRAPEDGEEDENLGTLAIAIAAGAALIFGIFGFLSAHFFWGWFFIVLMILVAVAQLLCYEKIGWFLALSIAALQIVAGLTGFGDAITNQEFWAGFGILFKNCVFWPLLELGIVWFVSNISAAIDERANEQEE